MLFFVQLLLFASKQKENNVTGSSTKGKGTKVRKERDILLANVALKAKIGALCERWMCPTPNGQCGSEHCFVHPDEADHFALSHAHMESWAAAILKGEQIATINKPPNNALFDRISPQSLAARSVGKIGRRRPWCYAWAVDSRSQTVNIQSYHNGCGPLCPLQSKR
ncbi:hypothetical protein B0H14DRAFT_2576260 [Mycena olivaceomarginata]|nr:hypothetical protein B0H14DRAFT_2576260 [Mycena olivaceomarginata]